MSSPFFPTAAESALHWLRVVIEEMPRPKPHTRRETFGRRLARLRQARGLTQRQLAPMVGISQRMLAYYETQTERPPAHLLPDLSRALGLTADELLGVRPLPQEPPVVNVRLWKRLQRLQDLPSHARKTILKVLDAYLARYVGDDKAG